MVSYINQASFKLQLADSKLIESAVKLLNTTTHTEYYSYERKGNWHVGLGSKASLSISPDGKESTITANGVTNIASIDGPADNVARKFLKDYGLSDSKAFGFVSFNYGALSRGLSFVPGNWPILSLLVPRIDICLQESEVTIKADDMDEINALWSLLHSTTEEAKKANENATVETLQNSGAYVDRVANALLNIADGQYKKVIASRAVNLASKIDIPQTLLQGRLNNTPKRSFALNHGGFQAAGFSPELVMLLENGRVETEPLAGTRAREGTEEEIAALKKDLLGDSKEVLEHVLSVQEAVLELESICPKETVVVEDFMTVRPRGAVQHLGSRVAGELAPGKDAWDALNVLFPSITASGIPKSLALEAIGRLEESPRELYSGAVLMIEGPQFLEAALVLRSCFQDTERQWLQAGAGVIAQSNPQRELMETCEKLASIAPWVSQLKA